MRRYTEINLMDLATLIPMMTPNTPLNTIMMTMTNPLTYLTIPTPTIVMKTMMMTLPLALNMIPAS